VGPSRNVRVAEKMTSRDNSTTLSFTVHIVDGHCFVRSFPKSGEQIHPNEAESPHLRVFAPVWKLKRLNRGSLSKPLYPLTPGTEGSESLTLRHRKWKKPHCAECEPERSLSLPKLCPTGHRSM